MNLQFKFFFSGFLMQFHNEERQNVIRIQLKKTCFLVENYSKWHQKHRFILFNSNIILSLIYCCVALPPNNICKLIIYFFVFIWAQRASCSGIKFRKENCFNSADGSHSSTNKTSNFSFISITLVTYNRQRYFSIFLISPWS